MTLYRPIQQMIYNKKLLNNEIAWLAIAYSIMHGGLLLIPNAVFWDDWLLYRSSEATILQTFREAGSIFNLTGHLHVFMQWIGIWSYKALTFLLMFGSGVLLNFILKRNNLLPREVRFLVVLLFLILPFNFARVAAINFPYSLCYFLFFLAWASIDRYRFTAVLLFLLSFNVNSLLVFYVLPILDLFYREYRPWTLSSLVRIPCRRPELIAAPFVFYFVKVNYFQPFGFYEGYNQNFQFINIANAVKMQFKHLAFTELNALVWLSLLAIVIYVFHKRRKTDLAGSDLKLSLLLLLLGGLSFFIGAFPYWILGHVPTFNEWGSRHQLLLPLGSSLIIAGLLAPFSKPVSSFIASALVFACLSVGILKYYDFVVDWSKQETLVKLFSQNKDIRSADVVLIVDNTIKINAIRRRYRFYEWNGLLEKAFGDQKRFAVDSSEINWYFSNQERVKRLSSAMYKAGEHEFKMKPKVALVEIEYLKNPHGSFVALSPITIKVSSFTSF
jgi:hypothetical protein